MNLITALSYVVVILFCIFIFFKSEIKSLMLRKQQFKCTNCTSCCKLQVKLEKEDIKRIKTNIDYILNEKGKRYIKRINGYCIFQTIRQGRSSCSIYPMRPAICRRFPHKTIWGVKCFDSRCSALKLPKFMRFL